MSLPENILPESSWAGYFAVLIAPVRHDKRLTYLDKLVFSELAAIADRDLVCDVNVKRIAGFYDTTPENVITSLKNLAACGCIKNPKVVDNRIVTELLKY